MDSIQKKKYLQMIISSDYIRDHDSPIIVALYSIAAGRTFSYSANFRN